MQGKKKWIFIKEFSHWSSSSWGKVIKRMFHSSGANSRPVLLLLSSFGCWIVPMFDCSIVIPFLPTSVFLVRYSYFAGWKQGFSPWLSSSWEKVVKVVFHSGSKAGRNIASPLILLLLLLLSFHCWIVPMLNCSNVFFLLPSVFPVRHSYFAGWKYEFSPW